MNTPDFHRQLAWAKAHMPITAAECARLPDLSHVRLGCSVHLTMNLLPSLEALMERGAKLFLTTCNPTTVRDEVVSYLKERGAEAYAWKDMPAEAYADATARLLEWQPTHTCEMGADITTLAHERGYEGIQVGLEATGSGINRLEGLDLRYPVFNWDDLPIKEGLHNRHMVGIMTWQTFGERTFLSLHGKRVIVVGYGSVGKGLADAAKAYGGIVSVVERDPARILEARFAGWHTGDLLELAPQADVVVTATGVANVVTAEAIRLLKPGAFLLNVGHVANEIDLSAIPDRHEVYPFVEACEIRGKTVYLFAGGSMANLTAGQGDSLNSFDITAAVMVSGVRFITTLEDAWPKRTHPLPKAVWLSAAQTAVKVGGW